MAICKECGKELPGKERLCSKCATKGDKVCRECGKKIGVLNACRVDDSICCWCYGRKKAGIKTRAEVEKETVFREKDEIINSYDDSKANGAYAITYLGGHPDMPKKGNGQLILTPKNLIFVVNNFNGDKGAAKKIKIPLKDIKELQAIPHTAKQTRSMASEVWLAEYFGGFNMLRDIFGKATLLIGIDDKGLKVGVTFQFESLGHGSDDAIERWKNEIISARHKAIK